jgi:multidrug efflux pump subunit AcrA (membrane-fusion protein)
VTKKLAIAIIVADLGFFTLSCTRSSPPENKAKPAIQADTEIIQLTNIPDIFEAPGTVRARTQTVLSSKVIGQITSLPVREGDRVRQDQVLVEIEGQDISARLRRAQAGETEARRALEEVDGAIRAAEAGVHAAEVNRDLAQTTQRRYEVLRERQSVSPQEFDEVEARFKAAASDAERARETLAATRARRSQVLARIEQALAEVEAARAALGYLRITSPIDGVVTARQAEPGMLATPGMPLLAVEDDRSYELESIVEEARAATVGIGQRARIQIDALAATVDGRVIEIVPAADPATRTYTVKLSLALAPAIRRALHSGFFGRASFSTGDRQAVTIPESALVRRGQLAGVYAVQNGVAYLRLVKTGKPFEKRIEILSGLSPGIRILTAPPAEMRDGVKIVDKDPEGLTP